MNLRRFLPAAALMAGGVLTAGGQTPDPKKADTPPAAPATPTAPATHPDLEKALEEFKKSNFDKAMEFIKSACEKDKNLAPPKCIMAQLWAQVNNQQGAQNARVLLEQASMDDPEHPDPFLFSGAQAINEGRLMDAMLCFERANALSSRTLWLVEQRKRFLKSSREGLAQVYANRRDFKQAHEQLRAMLSEDPKNAKVRVQVANYEFLRDQYDAALASLKQAYADDPSIDLPEVYMARFWDSKPKKEAAEAGKAEEWFKNALVAYPKDIKASREYARWLLNQGNTAGADAQLVAATQIDPNDKEVRALTGLSHRYKRQHKEAEAIFNALNLADRANPFYAWNLAICQAESDVKATRQQAVVLAQLTQQANPKSAEAVAILAWCFFKDERLDDAEKAMGVAAQASQGSFPPDTIYYFARILDKKGKSEDARNNLQKALDAKAPFVYRAEADEFQKALVAKHGPVPKDDKKPEEKKP